MDLRVTKMNDQIVSSLRSRFRDMTPIVSSEDNKISFSTKKEESHEALSYLKDAGFDHLSDITCVDYIGEKEFEVIYHLWSHAKKRRADVKVRISRRSPSIKSVSDLWAGAQMHERENHELFGINFKGNPNLSPLFLEDWEEIPPLRKNFDTRKYVRREYYGKK